jgi:predicted GNAT family N-acyltransferase
LSADCRLTVTVRPARSAKEVEAAQDLRVRVFCDEQGVSPEEELDGLDHDAVHIVALDESGVIATCRLRAMDDEVNSNEWRSTPAPAGAASAASPRRGRGGGPG